MAIYWGDHILPCINQADVEIESEVIDFGNELNKKKPDLLVLIVNHVGTERTLNVENLLKLKSRLGFKVLAIVPDHSPERVPSPAVYWSLASDSVVVFNHYVPKVHGFDSKKLIRTPFLPFNPNAFFPDSGKDMSFLFVGTNNRYRDLLCAFAQETGVKSKVILHDRNVGIAPKLDDYYVLLARSKMTLNNGSTHAFGPSVITGRVYEAMASRSLLLQQDFAEMREYFIPFVHYVPFANVHQLRIMISFLEKYEHYRQRIVERAYEWLNRYYTARQFWMKILTDLSRL